ncbi:MAG: polyphosphate kinase 2 [Hyphomicrobium sp.]
MAKAEQKSKGEKAAAKASAAPAKAFDIDNPDLPKAIDDAAMASGGYPYDKKLKSEAFEKELVQLQTELVKLQTHFQKSGERMVILFEGRDSAGKGGCIARFTAHLNPRSARTVALTKPTETERGQWYFQRYVPHLPTRGEMVLFDRSWYNRAGVERVMGFCTEDQVADFLRDAPQFEALLVQDGIKLFKFYLTIGREMQLKRFHERRHDPLKQWKLTDIDLAAIAKWDDYTRAQTEMFRYTHTATTPWTIIHANDQRRARLESIRVVLSAFDYADKDRKTVGDIDTRIVGSGPEFFAKEPGTAR